MSYTLKIQQIAVKDPDTGEYSGVDVLAEQTTEGLLNEIEVKGATVKNEVDACVADAEANIDELGRRADTIVDRMNSNIATATQAVDAAVQQGVDPTLTLTGIPADAAACGDLKSALNGIENTEGIIRWGTVGGGVLAPDPSSTGQTSVGITREDNILTLSGTSAIGTVRINITFSLFRASSAAALKNSIQTFLPFVQGHKYAIRFNYISGSDTDNKPVYIIVRTAEHQDVNSVSFEDGEIYKEITWDYDGHGYVFLYVPNASGVTFNDYRFSFTIIDLTTSQKPLYDYINIVEDHVEAKESFIGSFPPSYVIVDKTTNIDGTLSADEGNCTSRVISFADYVKVIAPEGINVTAVDCINQLNLTGNPLIIPPNVDVAFNFNKSNGVFNRVDFDSITFKSSKSCWNIFNNDFIHHVSGSSRIEAWNTEPANYERSFGYNMLETGDRWGFIVNTGNANNSISKLLIADIDLLLVSSEEMTLIVNDVLTVVPKATFYSIKKGDAFVVSSSVRIRNILILSDINSNLYYEIGNQNIGASLDIRCDSAFLLNDKLVMIKQTTGEFNVVKDNEIIQTGTIGDGVGHANSCNFIPESGMLYVSTWDDGKTIACYRVTDGETVSFEFVKNIIIDNADIAACEYYIADENEKVIIGLGWKYTYNKPTNESQNALEVSVYTKINGVYEITKRFLAFAPGELQGMTFNKKDNCIYYLAGAVSGYHHTGINAISLDGYSHVALSGAGSILNIETESIIQLTNSNNYLVVAHNGARFVCGIAD